jgi:hypothetical protein
VQTAAVKLVTQPTEQEPTQLHLSGQSVQASWRNSSLNDMFKVATVVQQIMTELSEAAPEEDKIVFITKIVFNLMKQNDHKSS